MKRTYKLLILSLAVYIVSFFSAQAQENSRFEIVLDYGINTWYKQSYQDLRFKSYFSGSGLQVFTLSSGSYNVSCKYSIAPKWQLGLNAAYEKISFDAIYKPNALIIYGGVREIVAYTVGAHINYNYIDYPFFKVYSGVGLAYTNVPIVINGASFHLTGCGIRVGKKLALHVEVGHGYRGKYNLGINYQI